MSGTASVDANDGSAVPSVILSAIHRRPRRMIRDGLRFCALEALVVGGMFAVTEAWLVPLLQTWLGAATAVIGLLTIIPQVAGIGLGPWSRAIIDWCGGNRQTALIMASVQVLCLLGLSVPLHAQSQSWAVPLAVTLIVVFGIVGVINAPAWIAWMGGLIPRPVMGRFTGWRNRLFHSSRLACAAAFAGIIHLLPLHESPWGLQLLLLLAAASRIASLAMLIRQPVPPNRPAMHGSVSQQRAIEQGGLWGFVRTMPRTVLGRSTMVWALLHLGVMIAGPFFASYMLSPVLGGGLGLGEQPFLFTALIYNSTIARLVTYPAAGRLVDLHGPAAVLRIAVVMIMLIPIGWVATSTLWIIMIFEVLSGIAWGLAESAVGPLLFSCDHDPQRRAQLVGWHQSVVLTCVVLGSGIGTLLVSAPWLPVLTGSSFHTLFLISMLARIPAVILAIRLLPRLRDLPQDLEGHGQLWRLIPGAGVTLTVGRGLGGVFRRTEGE